MAHTNHPENIGGENSQQNSSLLKKQAAADITGQLQVRPMVYTLYIGINLTIIMKQYGESEYRAPLSAVPM